MLAQVALVVVILVADAVHLETVIPCAKKCESASVSESESE